MKNQERYHSNDENYGCWIRELEKEKEGIAASLFIDNKMESLKTLIASGLPHYEYYFFSLENFLMKTEQIKEIYSLYQQNIVAKIMPCERSSSLPRFNFLNKTIDYTAEAIEKLIIPEYRHNYIVSLNEYDLSTTFCGAIVSMPENLTIEMIRGKTFVGLVHGKLVPFSASFIDRFGHKRMFYHNIEDITVRSHMWETVKLISEVYEDNGIPQYSQYLGYFEFVVSSKGIMFTDYKTLVGKNEKKVL